MKSSKFNIIIPMETEGDYKIYNTFYETHAVVDEEAKLLLENLHTPFNPLPVRVRTQTGFINGGLSDEAKEVISQLKESNIVIDDEVDEDLELEYYFQKCKFDTSELKANILTTYGCNLKCAYCFQEGVDSSRSLDMETCLRISSWLSERMEKVRPRTLRVMFYGGEPLLNKDSVKFLSQLLAVAAARRDVAMESSIITNGVLLNAGLIDDLVPLGLKSVRVTLDGDESAHNSKRHFRDGRGTFDLILKNLERIKGKVPIYLNGNFDDTTKDRIPKLLDLLVDRGFRGYIEKITFKPILKNIESAITGNSNCSEVCTFSDIPDVGDILYLIKETEKRGFKSRMGIELGPCEALSEHSYTIDPAGRIYKCAGFVGRNEFVIGDLIRGIYDYRVTRFMTVDPWRSECRGCAYTPICGGGCRTCAYVKHGDFRKIACDKPYFNSVSQQLMKEAA